MQSDKERIERLEEAYRKLWAEHEELKTRIKENYSEFKVIRDQFGVAPIQQHDIPTVTRPTEVAKMRPPSDSVVSNPSKSSAQWEKFIGEQLLSKIGLLVLLVGLVIGTKYAIDHNWLSIGLRIVGTYAIAGILGFFAYRFREKYTSFSAVLASGAVSISYFITYAAFSWYHVIPFGVSFVGLLICVAVAVYLAWYYNLVIIAHFGLIAAYVLPPLISTSNKHLSYYLAYMLAINIGMLIISLLKNWRSIRVPVIVWSNLVFITWFFLGYHEEGDWVVATVYCLIYFVLFHVSAILPTILRKENLPVISFGEILPVSLTSYTILRYILYAADCSLTTILLFSFLLCCYFGFWILQGIKRKDSVLQDVNMLLIVGVVLLTIGLDANVYLQPMYVLIICSLFVYVMLRYEKRQYDTGVTYGLVLSVIYFMVIQVMNNHYDQNSTNALVSGSLMGLILLVLIGVIHKLKRDQSQYNVFETVPVLAYAVLFITPAMELIRAYEWSGEIIKSLDHKLNRAHEMLAGYASYSLVVGWGILLFVIFLLVRLFVLKLDFSKSLVIQFAAASGLALLIFSGLSYFSIPLFAKFEFYFNPYILGRYIAFFGIIGMLYKAVQSNIAKNGIVWFSLATLWILSLELSQWSIISGFGAGYKILLTLLWVAFSVGMIVRGLMKDNILLRSTAMGILGVSMVKLFFYDLTNLSTITKVVVFMLVGGLLLVGAYFYQRISKSDKEEMIETDK